MSAYVPAREMAGPLERMDDGQRLNGRTDVRTDGRTDEQTNGRTDGRTVGRADVWKDERTGGRMNGRTLIKFDMLAGHSLRCCALLLKALFPVAP